MKPGLVFRLGLLNKYDFWLLKKCRSKSTFLFFIIYIIKRIKQINSHSSQEIAPSTLKNRIFLSPPHINPKVEDSLKAVFESNFIAPVGPALEGFELDIAAKVGSNSVAALASGTSAIHLALVLLKVGRGDFVITQSKTHIGGVNPILYQGATPIFVDSERDTWNMCPVLLKEALLDQIAKGNKPKAIILVHVYGMPAKLEEIIQIASEYEIPLIEDAAESLGSKYKNQYTGTFGLFGIYSFNGNKIITTGGGGALISNNSQLIKEAKFLASQGRDESPHYQHSVMAFNYKLSNVLAGIGRGQIVVLDERVAKRRQNFIKYLEFFQNWNEKGFDIQFQKEPNGMYSNRWLSTVLIRPEANKGITNGLISDALEKGNIESRPLWKPMHLQPLFKNCIFYGNGVSEYLFENGLCLPSGSNLGNPDFDRIFEVFEEVFRNSLRKKNVSF